ncbi:hypothetical protein GIW81_00795 [Hyphomicrobium sp. xq]|uniref:Uncharacterized protein n=1 Tax=Hyphomicrobium album TaxID=2665159 RepID=A0A6I3KBR3_9HYPH|nr:hypothetical protein [Hyphomicrobium album]MTD92865.1 hypothetical protein [Hyphomicrobium album]
MTQLYIQRTTETARPCRCDNCGWTGTEDDVNAISDAQERLEAGGTVPAGECPEDDCGALAYIVTPEPEAPRLTVADLVAREVVYCVSTLVYDATSHAQVHTWDDNEEDARIDLWTPMPDYDEACAENDITLIEVGADEWTWTGPGGREGATWDTKQEAAIGALEACRVDVSEYSGEVYEHWIVSEWFADKLEAAGERVVRDWHGLTIWARTTTGQAIYMDSVVQSIHADLFRNTAVEG